METLRCITMLNQLSDYLKTCDGIIPFTEWCEKCMTATVPANSGVIIDESRLGNYLVYDETTDLIPEEDEEQEHAYVLVYSADPFEKKITRLWQSDQYAIVAKTIPDGDKPELHALISELRYGQLQTDWVVITKNGWTALDSDTHGNMYGVEHICIDDDDNI